MITQREDYLQTDPFKRRGSLQHDQSLAAQFSH
jgi:hypothetical protein